MSANLLKKLSTYQLLLVDDSAMNLDTLLATLGDSYDLRIAIDGQSALDLIASDYLPDLILLDIMMPGLDGYDVCRKLKADEKTREIPIIFLTALDSDADEAKGLELGAVDYISKPFNPAIVNHRVKTQLELKQHRDQLQKLVDAKTHELTKSYKDLKQVHDQMLQQEKMASIGQLAAGVAHEINNPAGFVGSNLNSLQKYVDKLNQGIAFMEKALKSVDNPEITAQLKEMKRKLKLDFVQEDIDDLITESKDGIERIALIVRNLKSFSRAEDDTPKLIDLQECLEGSLNIAWNEIKYKAKVEKNYQELPPIKCLPQQLSQVFVNLMVNAAQAIEDQGVITVATRQEKDWAVVEISDDGSGISPENLERIFEAFYTTKEVGKGTGLGLSICHDILQKHQGTISVESEIGEGTRFTIKLPLSEEEI
ncbi:MAG: response regulator [Desulfuromusa sp.]|nr:response regulator [Desulfuromusa sp.]